LLLTVRLLVLTFALFSVLWGRGNLAWEESGDYNRPPLAQTQEALLYITPENYPQKLYIGQIFAVTLKITSLNRHLPYSVTIKGGKNVYALSRVKYLSPKSRARVTFYFKATGTPVVVPRFIVQYENGTGRAGTTPRSIPAVRLNPPRHYSGVLATSLQLLNYQASTYDQNRNILVLDMNASFANLRDFHLPGALKEGIDTFKGGPLASKMVYYAVLPESTEQVRFSYFNLTKNRYETFRIPVLVKRSSVSTQTNLDPQASEFTRFKIAVTLFFIALWLLLWFKTRRWRYPFYVTLATAYLLTYLIPLKKVCLKRNTVVYLLPTPQSTAFMRMDKETEAKEMAIRGDYVKIQLPNNRIGWIKHEDLCQN